MTAVPVQFTILSGQTTSDWQSPLSEYGPPQFRLPSLETDTNCPTTTLTLAIRDPADQQVKNVVNFSLSIGASQAFGADDLAGLASLLNGREWRFSLETSPTASSIITLRVT